MWTTAGWLSLAVILDLSSRLVIGWAMGPRLTVELASRNPLAGLLHHSIAAASMPPRGTSCCCPLTASPPACRGEGTAGTTPGWSASSGRSSVNASPRHDATRDDAKREILEYREVFSNRPHRQATLGDHSLAEYEARTVVA